MSPENRRVMKRIPLTISAVVLVLCLGLVSFAAAASVRLDFNDLPAPPWELGKSTDAGTAGVSDGILTIDTPGFLEFLLFSPNGEWHQQVSNSRGWVIETRLLLDPATTVGNCNTGAGSVVIWANDHTNLLIVGIDPDKICLAYPDSAQFPMSTTDGYHVYRIESRLRNVKIYVDGVLRIDHTLSTPGGGSNVLKFGDGVGGSDAFPSPSKSYWDYFWYDVNPNALAIAAIGDKTVNAGEALTFPVTATGGSDPLTFAVVGLPNEATLNPTEGSRSREFLWTPNSGEVGTYYPCFSVSDAEATATQCPALTVLAGACPDRDLDGVPDPGSTNCPDTRVDNCPDVYNPNQADLNHNGIGDACESAGFAGTASTATTVNNTPTTGFFTIGQPVVLHACVTFAPTDPTKPTFVVKPDSSFVLIEVVDASGTHLPLTNMIERGLLSLPRDQQIIFSTTTLCTDVVVTDQFTLPPGQFTINAEYVTLGVKDPGVDKDNNCTDGTDGCFQPILQTRAPAGSKTVTIRDTTGALGQLDALIAAVGQLSDQGLRGSLGAKLRAARASLLRANVGVTCNQLGAFNNEDAAQSGNKLSASQATNFADTSNFIRTLLVCS